MGEIAYLPAFNSAQTTRLEKFYKMCYHTDSAFIF